MSSNIQTMPVVSDMHAQNFLRLRYSSINAHVQNGALAVLLALLPITVANTLVMHNSKQITFQ
jgi:hypothetical protein